MRARPTPLPDPPDRHPYLRAVAHLPEGDTPLVFRRLPSALQLSALAFFDRPDAPAAIEAFLQGALEPARVAALVRAYAALIVAMWADPVLELEAPPEQHTADSALGELWEAGWDELTLVTLGQALVSAWRRPMALLASVQARVDFTAPDPAGLSGSASGSPESADTPPPGGEG